jgi:hypothetical protein
MAGLVQTDRTRRGRRQIDLPAPHKRAAIVDPHDHASAVAHPDKRSKRQSAMSRCHRRTIEAFSVGGSTAAQAVTAAVDACNFSTHELAAAKQHRSPQKQFQIAREHIPISPVFDPSKHEGFDGIPKPSQSSENWSSIKGKISAEPRGRN